jgi:hypothetical protein
VILKPHGVVRGRLEMRPDSPPELKIGVFAFDVVPVWVRFSSDTVPAIRAGGGPCTD